MKKLISIILSILILCSVFSVPGITANGAEIKAEQVGDASGSYGTNVTYSYNSTTCTLTISGTGAMTNYWYSSSVPWYSYRSSIKTVTIGNSVTSIGDFAFSYCSSLTNVTIGNSVTSIGGHAFMGCTNLTSIIIPDSVTSISATAFSNCPSLTSIIVNKNNKIYDSRNDCNAIIETESNTLILGCCNSIIPDSVTSIGNSAFWDCSSLKNITIGDNVTSIGAQAFEYCEILESITIPHNVKSIGYSAFAYCNSLTNVSIPDSVTSIGKFAFSECTNLASVNIGNGVNSIGFYAFSACTNLASVNIGNGVNSIDSRTFSGCTNLTSIIVNKNNKIYDSRNDCNAIVETESNTLILGCCNSIIPDSVTSIGKGAFEYCYSLTNVSIPDSVTSIGDCAFYNCSKLTKITIPNSVISIGGSAFLECTNLKSVYISDIEAWCNIDFGNSHSNPLYNGADLYLNDELVTDLVIPDSVTGIGNYAFYGYTSLKSIDILRNVTYIGEAALGYTSDYKKYSITIKGDNNSAAYDYAKKNGFTFIDIYPSVTVNLTNDTNDKQTASFIINAPNQIKGYYLGTDPIYSNNKFVNSSSTHIEKSISDEGTYYFTVIDTRGFLSQTVSFTLYRVNLITDYVDTLPDYVLISSDNQFTLPTLTYNRHVFLGWQDANSQLVTEIKPTQNSTYYAQWREYYQYDVTYNTNGSTEIFENQIKYENEDLFLYTATPKLTGYRFMGWSTEENGPVTFSAGDKFTKNENLTLYAVWEDAHTPFTITYDANGGSNAPNDQLGISGEIITLSDSEPTRKNCIFKGWSTSPDGTVEYQPGTSFRIYSNITLYAIWYHNCMTCDADGKIYLDCSSCDGLGFFVTYENYKCRTCGGDGWGPSCAYCEDGYIYSSNGDDRRLCVFCNGSGIGTEYGEAKCSSCNGSGSFRIRKKTDCEYCVSGKNKTNCSDCYGRGYLYPCSNNTHSYNTGVITKEATCIKDGEITYTCKKCYLHEKSEIIPAKGHTEVIDKPIPPTCTKTGLTEGKHCSVCDEILIAQQVIQSTGHTVVIDVAITPTCTESGLTEGKHCSVCKEILIAQDVIPSTGHNYNDGIITIKATCTDDGTKIYTCTTCNDEKTESIPSTGHSIKTVGVKKATYFAKGHTGKQICKNCNKTISKGKKIAKLKLKTPKVRITGPGIYVATPLTYIKIKYKKVPDATGFQVKYVSKGKTHIKTYNTKKTVSKIIKNLKVGTYKVRVRAFKKTGKKIAYSNWSDYTKVSYGLAIESTPFTIEFKRAYVQGWGYTKANVKITNMKWDGNEFTIAIKNPNKEKIYFTKIGIGLYDSKGRWIKTIYADASNIPSGETAYRSTLALHDYPTVAEIIVDASTSYLSVYP